MLDTSFGGSDANDNNGDSCETSSCGESSNCRESVDCGQSGNCLDVGDCGQLGGGETGELGETCDGGKPGSRSTLKSKL